MQTSCMIYCNWIIFFLGFKGEINRGHSRWTVFWLKETNLLMKHSVSLCRPSSSGFVVRSVIRISWQRLNIEQNWLRIDIIRIKKRNFRDGAKYNLLNWICLQWINGGDLYWPTCSNNFQMLFTFPANSCKTSRLISTPDDFPHASRTIAFIQTKLNERNRVLCAKVNKSNGCFYFVIFILNYLLFKKRFSNLQDSPTGFLCTLIIKSLTHYVKKITAKGLVRVKDCVVSGCLERKSICNWTMVVIMRRWRMLNGYHHLMI